MFDYLIVGAGFAGSVLAERLARESGKSILIVDKRPHIGGNAYDRYNEDGILIHPYGPHIFHTNSERIFRYLSQFTEWRPYEHRVLAQVTDAKGDEVRVPIPINRTTVNELYDLNLQTEEECAAFYAERAEPKETKRTSEDVVISVVGRELYEKFFRGYTRKQWELDPSELDAQVTARVPTRTNTDDRYFTDEFQFMPLHGYTRMFEKMLDHPNIIMLNTDYKEIRELIPFREMIFTGPVDEYFDYRFGKLPYRSLEFKHETLEQENVLPVGVVNYPDEKVPFTRITEFKALTGQVHPKSGVVYEFPRSTGDPYYPIPKPDCTALYNQYKELADNTKGVHFVGRLATYKYYNMDQVVGQALMVYDKITGKREEAPREKTVATPAQVSRGTTGALRTPATVPIIAATNRVPELSTSKTSRLSSSAPSASLAASLSGVANPSGQTRT